MSEFALKLIRSAGQYFTAMRVCRISVAAGVIALAFCLASCVTAPHSITSGTSQLSRDLVDNGLVNGKTTKADVIALLGEPQSTVSTSSSAYGAAGKLMPAETWTYMKMFRRDAAEKGFGHAVAYSMVNPASQGYDRGEVSILVVMFDARGRVSGHTFSTSAAGAKR